MGEGREEVKEKGRKDGGREEGRREEVEEEGKRNWEGKERGSGGRREEAQNSPSPGTSKLWPKGHIQPPSISVNQVLVNLATPSHVCILCGCF